MESIYEKIIKEKNPEYKTSAYYNLMIRNYNIKDVIYNSIKGIKFNEFKRLTSSINCDEYHVVVYNAIKSENEILYQEKKISYDLSIEEIKEEVIKNFSDLSLYKVESYLNSNSNRNTEWHLDSDKKKEDLNLLIQYILKDNLKMSQDNIKFVNISYLNNYLVLSVPVILNSVHKNKELIINNNLSLAEITELIVKTFKDFQFPEYNLLPFGKNLELEETFFSESPIKKHTVNLLKDSEGLNYVKVNDKVTLLESDEYVVTQWGNQEYIIKGFSSVITYLDNPSTQVKLICKI